MAVESTSGNQASDNSDVVYHDNSAFNVEIRVFEAWAFRNVRSGPFSQNWLRSRNGCASPKNAVACYNNNNARNKIMVKGTLPDIPYTHF